MISLINWAKALKLIKSSKPFKINKYEGLKKATEILQTNSSDNYQEKVCIQDNLITEASTILGLLEIDKELFDNNFYFHLNTSKALYQYIINMDSSNEHQKKLQEKLLAALQGILTNRIHKECKQILRESSPSMDISEFHETFNKVRLLLQVPEQINTQTIQEYIKEQSPILSTIACIIYGCKQLCNIENSNNILIKINNIINLLINYPKGKIVEVETIEKKEDTVISTEKKENIGQNRNFSMIPIGREISHSFSSQKEITENSFFLNLQKDGIYVVTENQISEDNLIKRISINPDKDVFILQCYEHGSINKVPVRVIKEKKKERKYLNGYYIKDNLKEVFVISQDTYIAIISQYNNNKFIKIYSTEYISEHLALGLKGNQVVGTNVDSTEYILISPEYINQLPQRLIYNSVTPLGKNIKNLYYENDILTLKKIGILKT